MAMSSIMAAVCVESAHPSQLIGVKFSPAHGVIGVGLGLVGHAMVHDARMHLVILINDLILAFILRGNLIGPLQRYNRWNRRQPMSHF